jgi:preprotein translocase subunit YajC
MFESLAYAQQAAPQAGEQPSPIFSFLPLILIFIIFYFLLIRPQQKRQQQLQKMITDLKKGDRVVTSGGIIGTIMSIQNDYMVLKVGDNDNTKIEILKSSIAGLYSPKTGA